MPPFLFPRLNFRRSPRSPCSRWSPCLQNSKSHSRCELSCVWGAAGGCRGCHRFLQRGLEGKLAQVCPLISGALARRAPAGAAVSGATRGTHLRLRAPVPALRARSAPRSPSPAGTRGPEARRRPSPRGRPPRPAGRRGARAGESWREVRARRSLPFRLDRRLRRLLDLHRSCPPGPPAPLPAPSTDAMAAPRAGGQDGARRPGPRARERTEPLTFGDRALRGPRPPRRSDRIGSSGHLSAPGGQVPAPGPALRAPRSALGRPARGAHLGSSASCWAPATSRPITQGACLFAAAKSH